MNISLAILLLLHCCLAATLSPSDCPYHGYETIVGDNRGMGNVGEEKITDVSDLGTCAGKCNATDNCCSFMWSPNDENCLLYRQCNPDRPNQQYHDYKYCKSTVREKQRDCPYHGYETIVGDNRGMGNVGEEKITDVPDLGTCAGKCNTTDNCCSFMWSPADENCLLYRQCNPDRPNQQYQDYKYCKSPLREKQRATTSGGNWCARIYEEKNYGGRSKTIWVTPNTTPAWAKADGLLYAEQSHIGEWNDKISSVQVNVCCFLWAYRDEEFGGYLPSTVFVGRDSNKSDYNQEYPGKYPNIKGDISSYKCFCKRLHARDHKCIGIGKIGLRT